MIQLTQDDKNFITNTLKPYLKKNDWYSIRKLCNKEDSADKFRILCFMAEQGLDVLSGMSAIPAGFFSDAPITKFTVPEHIKSIKPGAFSNSMLEIIEFKNGVESIAELAFSKTLLSAVMLPDTLETIGKYAFANCSNLQSVFIPDSVTILPQQLFRGSDNVTIYMNSRKDMPKRFALQIPRAEVEWYKAHTKVKEA